MSDAARSSKEWKLGVGYEFQTRPDGYPALQRVYGLGFKEIRTMDLGLLYRALTDGGASGDAAGIFDDDPMCIATTVPTSAHAAKNGSQ